MTVLMSRLPAPENYAIRVDRSHHSRVKIFAPHAGCIEPCTGPTVHAIAMDRFDCFIFSGTRKKDCFHTLHVTSTHYDEPQCLEMARDAMIAIAFHGCDGDDSFLMIGGGNREYSLALSTYLTDRGYTVPPISGNLRGEDEQNFVNRARMKGIQVECSVGFRRLLFPSFPKTIQRDPIEFPRFIDTMRDWMEKIERELGPTA